MNGLNLSPDLNNNKFALIFSFLFWILVAGIPFIVINEWGDGFDAPKTILLAIITLGAVIFYRPPKSVIGTFWHIGSSFLVALGAISFFYITNPSLAFTSFIFLSALCFIPLFIEQNTSKISFLLGISLVTSLVIGSIATWEIFFRMPIIHPVRLDGSTIGRRNAVSFILVQLIPLLLLLYQTQADTQKQALKQLFIRLLAIVALILSAWVALAYRTRSAWWVLAFYAAAFLFLSFKKSHLRQTIQKISLLYFITLIVAIASLGFLPTGLRWTSSTPYIDSLYSMASPKYSNGRIELWGIALEMIKSSPVLGVGIGQYPPTWRAFIPLSDAKPEIFSATNPELPLFNDYLQNTVELGMVGGMMTIILFAFFPLWLFLQNLKKPLQLQTVFLLLVCIGTGINALFDAPFHRPTSVLIYALVVGFIIKKETKQTPHISFFTTTYSRVISFVTLSILIISIVCMGWGNFNRYKWVHSPQKTSLDHALAWWPWDENWGIKHLKTLLKRGDLQAADILVQAKKTSWPYDAKSHLMEGLLLKHLNQPTKAIESFRKAMVLAPGAKCHLPAYKQYLAVLKSYPEVKPLPKKELTKCHFSIDSNKQFFAATAVQNEMKECVIPEILSSKAIFAPQCNEILYSSNINGPVQPFVLPLTKTPKNPIPLFSDKQNDYFVQEISKDCRWVSLVTDNKGDEHYRIVLFDREKQKLIPISLPELKNAGEPSFSADGQHLFYVAGRELIVHATGQQVPSHRIPIQAGITQAVWSTSPGEILVFTRQKALLHVSLDTASQKTLLKLPAKSISGLHASGQMLYFASDHESNYSQLYQFDLSNKLLTRLTNDPFDHFNPVLSGSTVWFRKSIGGKICLDSVPSGTSKKHQIECSGVSYTFSPDKNGIFRMYAGANTPLTIQRLSWNGTAENLLPNVPTITPVEILPVQSENELPHFLFTNKSNSSLAVWLHGGPREFVSPRYNPFIANLVAHGYDVLALNYPGSTGAGNTFELLNLREQEMIQQQLPAIEKTFHAFQATSPHYKNVLLIGVSYGAGLMHRLPLKSSGQVSKIVDFSGRTIIGAKEQPKLFSPSPPPALFLYGDNDPMLVAKGRKDLLEYYAGNGAQFAIFPNEGHVLRSRTTNQNACNALVSFATAPSLQE